MENNKMNINWYPGHMAKTKKQIIDDLKLIDIIIEVLDARAPRSSQNPDVSEYCRNKTKILVLNKSDLADENVTLKWIEYYKNKSIPCIQSESNTGKGIKEIINQIHIEYKKIEEKYMQKGRIGRPARVMILGIPNVGKSTLINSLAKKSIAKVGNKPGVTKDKQWIKIDKNIELMDTPGMLWPKISDDTSALHLAYLNSIGENAIDNEEISYNLLNFLVKNYKDKIEKKYDILIGENEETINIRDKIAIKKGAIISGGKINYQKVSEMILNDFRTGKLGRISLEYPKI